MRVISIVTDCVDVAAAELRLSLLRELGADAYKFDLGPVIPVYPLSTLNAAFIIRLIAEASLPGSMIFSVVNSIQEQPSRVAGMTKNKDLTFIGRDTGQFGWLTEDFGCAECVVLDDGHFVPFGGKNVYPQFVARLANGAALATCGTPKERPLQALHIRKGDVVHIDNFGLIKMFDHPGWYERERLKEGQKLRVDIVGKASIDAVFTKRMMSLPDGTYALYPGSSLSGFPELGKVRGNAAGDLKCVPGDQVRFYVL